MRTTLAAAALFAVMVCPSPATAQSQGIVTIDGTSIWRSDASVVIAVVNSGAVLQLLSTWEGFYEIVIPDSLGGRGRRGLIATSRVRLLEGSPPPPVRTTRPSEQPETNVPPTAPPGGPPAPTVDQAGFPIIPQDEPDIAFRAYGNVGLMFFSARDSFEATFGAARGPAFGGGVQVRFANGFFLEGGYEWFRKTGERVFVNDGEVFQLGVDNTITIEPLTATAGYRFGQGRVTPYVGGGVGSYRFRESAPVADDEEDVDERHIGYHVLGGLEFSGEGWLAAAVEGQYRTVPDGLGSGGVSALFGEDNLGGIVLQFKIMVGR
jgi:opacity protein-like surface antigen